MKHRCALLLALALTATAAAQVAPPRAIPFDTRADGSLAPRAQELAALAERPRVILTGVVLPSGAVIDLELERVALEPLAFGVQVDGKRVPDALGALDLTVWMGSVSGDPGSEVALALSRFGSRGWIATRGELAHLLATPDERGDWSQSRSRWVDDAELARRGVVQRPFCLQGELPAAGVLAPTISGGAQAVHTSTLYECKVAIETDWQLNQVFGGNLTAEMTYVTTLMAWVSQRFQQQVDVLLTYPYVQFYTSSNDPWSTQETGGGAGGLLGEFQSAWQFNVPGGAHIGHFLSGAGLGGGVAWLPGLCNAPFNFSVCGNIDASTPFPIAQGPANWDFMVSAHELGHNFGAPHTHDYCPPLDQCAPPGYFGQCQTQSVCTSQGTLMSYCHLCPGGLANITTFFHPLSASDMRGWVEASGCLPVYADDPYAYCAAKVNSLGCTPAIAWSGHPTLSGPDDFVLSASNVINNKLGMFFYGGFSASIPFHGGTLCVQPPIERTPIVASDGSLPPAHDCSGELFFLMSHAEMAPIGAGNTLFGQFWYRDLQSQGGVGLSDAVSFTLYD